MTATRRFLLVLALIALFAYLLGGAMDQAAAGSAHSRSVAAIRLVFPAATENAAIRVARCETGGTFNPRAVGRAGERGIFQIHPVHFGWAQPSRLFDPVWNAKVAYKLSRGGTNWRPWTCRP